MKNKILLFATLVLVSIGSFASTNTTTNTPLTNNTYYNGYGESFTFVEGGITFAVFQNGEFDFYINPRAGFNFGYHSNNVNITFNSGYNYDAYVQYDDFGAIIQVENIPVFYDYYGRVTRIGNIDINYNYGRLVRLGGLHVYYDRNGYYSHYSGYINVYNRRYVYHPYHVYFARPLFDFRIVSHVAYRNHYKPVRHKYYRDHSRNKYYKNNNSRNSYTTTRRRVATNNVPKHKNNTVSRIERTNTNRNYSYNTNRNSNNNTIKRTTERNTTVKRTNGNSSIKNTKSRTVIKSTPNRTIQEKRTVTTKKPVKVQERKTVNTRKPVKVQEKKNTVKNNTRTPVKKQSRTEYKRRS